MRAALWFGPSSKRSWWRTLHFEKGTSFARLGPLPPRDTRATLDRLEAAVAITGRGGFDAVSGTAPMGQWTLG